MRYFNIIAVVCAALLACASQAYAQSACVDLSKAIKVAQWAVHVNKYSMGDRSCSACTSQYPSGMPGATIPGPPSTTGECCSYDCSSLASWVVRQVPGQTSIHPGDIPSTFAMWGQGSMQNGISPNGWKACNPSTQPVCVGLTEWGGGGPDHAVVEVCGKIYSASCAGCSPDITDNYQGLNGKASGSQTGSGSKQITWITPRGLEALTMASCNSSCTATAGLGGASPGMMASPTSPATTMTPQTNNPNNTLSQMLPMMMMSSMMQSMMMPMMSMMSGMNSGAKAGSSNAGSSGATGSNTGSSGAGSSSGGSGISQGAGNTGVTGGSSGTTQMSGVMGSSSSAGSSAGTSSSSTGTSSSGTTPMSGVMGSPDSAGATGLAGSTGTSSSGGTSSAGSSPLSPMVNQLTSMLATMFSETQLNGAASGSANGSAAAASGEVLSPAMQELEQLEEQQQMVEQAAAAPVNANQPANAVAMPASVVSQTDQATTAATNSQPAAAVASPTDTSGNNNGSKPPDHRLSCAFFGHGANCK